MAFTKSPCVSVRQLTRLRAAERDAGIKPLPTDSKRPKVYSDCATLPRPCPFVGCRHHLFLNVMPNGSIQFPFGNDVAALEQMDATCSLDVAKHKELSREDTGKHLNLSHEWVRRFQQDGLRKLQAHTTMQELEP